MNRIEVEHYKRILQGLLDGLERPPGKLAEIAIENTSEALDQVQNAADRALAIRQLELSSTRLRELKEALERIADGSYGTCLRCDAEISPKRLQALPWAAYCLACQDIADREQSLSVIDEFVSRFVAAH